MGKAVKKIFHGISKIFSPVLSLVGVVTDQWYLAAIGLGLSFFDSSKSPKIPNIKIADDPIGHLVNTKKSGGYIPIIYGRTRIGGNVFFAHSEGNNNKYLHLAIGLGCARTNINDKLWVENIYFDGVPVGVYKKISQSSSEIKYSVNSQVTKIYIAVIYNVHIHGYDNEWGYEYNYTNQYTKYFTIAHGNTASDDYVSAEFSNNTLTVKTKSSDVSLSRVSTGKYQINNVDEWILPKDNLFEYVFYDGSTWWKWDSNGGWEKDTAYKDESGWSGEPSPIKKVLIENGFHTPCHVAFLAIKLIYNQNRYQKIPTITCEVVRYNRDGNEKWTVAECIYDFLINREYGLGIDSHRIDIESFDNAIQYCKDNDFYFNGAILEGRAAEILKNLCEHIRADIIYYEGKFQIKIKDLRDSFIDPLYSDEITEEHIVAETFNVSQSDFSSIPNRIRVKYFDPTLDYKINTLELSFPGTEDEDDRYMDINLWGYEKEKAEYFANYYLERARLSTTFSFAVTHEFIDLKVGDLVKLDYKPFGIEDTLVRITSLRLNPYGTLQITAILEDEKLYDKEMNLNIYNIDLTELPDPYEPLPDIDTTTITIEKKSESFGDNQLEEFILLGWEYEHIWLDYFEVYIKKPLENSWIFYGVTTENFIEIKANKLGNYEIKILPVSIFGVRRGMFEVETIEYENAQSILSERSVICKIFFWDYIYTTDNPENSHHLPEVFNSYVMNYYAGVIDKKFANKNFSIKPITITKNNNKAIFQFDKTDGKIYKILPISTNERQLIYDFGSGKKYCNFGLDAFENFFGVLYVTLNDNNKISQLNLDEYNKITNESHANVLGLGSSFDNVVCDVFYYNKKSDENYGRGLFLLYNDGFIDREMWLLGFNSYVNGFVHKIPADANILNLNTNQNLLGVALIDDYKYCYAFENNYGKTELRYYYYNPRDADDSNNDSDNLLVELDVSNYFIEDFTVNNFLIRILLKSLNSYDRYIVELIKKSDNQIILNNFRKIDLFGG